MNLEFGILNPDRETVQWDPGSRSVVGMKKRTCGALVLEAERSPDPDPEKARKALLDGIHTLGVEGLPWSGMLRRWRCRMMFLRRTFPDRSWPDLSDETLMSTLDSWLGPAMAGAVRLDDLDEESLKQALFSRCTWKQHRELEQLAPPHLTVPSGNRKALDYSGEIPVLAVKLQEMFGCRNTPTVAGGTVPVLLHLLSPAGRPVQVTRDLESFWQKGYESVKKELKGRYPRHPWPDDPLTATPTAGAKRWT